MREQQPIRYDIMTAEAGKALRWFVQHPTDNFSGVDIKTIVTYGAPRGTDQNLHAPLVTVCAISES